MTNKDAVALLDEIHKLKPTVNDWTKRFQQTSHRA